MRYVDYLDKALVKIKKERSVYWPKILPRVKIRPTGDFYHLGSWRITLRKIELWFSIPLRARYVERYALEHLATYKGHAKRRLLVCWDYVPFRGRRLQWQEKFKPVEGKWYDDYPFQRRQNASKNQRTQGSGEEGTSEETNREEQK